MHMCAQHYHIKNIWPFIAQPTTHFSYLSWSTHSPFPFDFFSFMRQSFFPIFGASADFCIVLTFPWILSFHQWLHGFAFELNQISLWPDKGTASVYVGEGKHGGKWDVCALWWPSLAHMSYFQLSFIVIIATAMAHCMLFSKWYTWLRILKLLTQVCPQGFIMCASLHTRKDV